LVVADAEAEQAPARHAQVEGQAAAQAEEAPCRPAMVRAWDLPALCCQMYPVVVLVAALR
jgi:hypothetical protein